MPDRRQILASMATLAGTAALAGPRPAPSATAAVDAPPLRLVRIIDDRQAELTDGARRSVVARGEAFGPWTLMEIVPADGGLAVLEDFTRRDGDLLIVGRQGVLRRLAKSAETTADETGGKLLGHSRAEVKASASDLLGNLVLARAEDPDFESVAPAFPPLRSFWGGTYNFLGSPETMDKVWFQYGGRSPNFDPAIYQPSIDAVRAKGQTCDGLVGGYLPILRFVYPENDDVWSEMIAFAPLRMANDNPRFQPVWYRVSRIEKGRLVWSRTVDSYLPFPPRVTADSKLFYADLAAFPNDWDALLEQAMTIDLPEARVADMSRHCLIRAIMTRSAGDPKYGVADKNYANSEHDGFPDTFTVETEAMLEWGLIDRAGAYIDNYLNRFVRDDGSILYRGPEIGQYGRMLTLFARYADLGGDPKLLLRHRTRIDAIARLLLTLRAQALRLPPDDPAYGMIAGWSEADSCLEPHPSRYMQPYFSNSTEAARGFADLGRVWQRIGGADRAAQGKELAAAAEALRRDLAVATRRSLLTSDGGAVLPSIAGAKEPMHVAFQRDRSDPQYRSYRAYMEMLHSGVLPADQVAMVCDYRANHHDVLCGIPIAYGYQTGELAGFLSYGHGYGLIQIDRVREALLLAYSHMAHQHTRGMWMAPETRKVLSDEEAAPYCSPAQLVVPLMWKWLLLFEEPDADILWLAKGAPRRWLVEGQSFGIAGAPTRWGRVGYRIETQGDAVRARINLPAAGIPAETRLRLRPPLERPIRTALLDGKPWHRFDAVTGTLIIPPGRGGEVAVAAQY
jgi:hypothetical protein